MTRHALALCLALLVTGAGCRRSEPSAAGGPIVLISIDTLRADRLAAYGYPLGSTPALDAFAREAVLFQNAYSHYPMTLPSHVSMLTGLLPTRHGVRDNAGYALDSARHPTLATRLAERGYASGGFVSSFVLAPETGVAAGFATYDSPGGPRSGAPLEAAQRGAPATLEPALAWLGTRGPGPFFLFVHFYEPHAPYAPPEPYRSCCADLYDGEVAAADGAVAEVVAALRLLGRYDEATVVVTADHGEGLGDHDEHRHGIFLYRSTLHVPLLVKLPRGERGGERISRPVGLVDLAPTLLRLAGAPTPAGLDGVDLLAEPRPDENRTIYAETFYPRLHFGWSDLQALMDARWSYLRGPAPELFDLATDPGQTNNVLVENRREQSRLARALEESLVPLEAPKAVDEETARKLAALGYLSAGGAVTRLDLPDPRTQVHLLEPLEEGLDAYWEGRYADAVAPLRAVLAENPDMKDVWAFLARSFDQLRRPADALEAWEHVLDLSGGGPSTALVVAERALELGRLERAAALAASVAAADPAGALDVAIRIDLAAGRLETAERRMHEAIARGTASQLVRRHLAIRALASGDALVALDLLDGATEQLEPASLVLRALALADAGKGEEGTRELERARLESDDSGTFFADLGEALVALGRLERAREAYRQAVRLAPRDGDSWSALGVVLLRLDDAPSALAAWSRAVEVDPGQIDAWYNLGVVASRTGDARLALRAFERFLSLAPPATPAEQRRLAESTVARLRGG